MLDAINNALTQFHENCVIFEESGVYTIGFSLSHQHLLVHYWHLIHAFRDYNGLCSSIMELKHIKAVKEPWHQLSHFKALGQMLVTNQRNDKLIACHVSFMVQHMLNSLCLKPMAQHHELLALILILIPINSIVKNNAIKGPRVIATIMLSKTLGKH